MGDRRNSNSEIVLLVEVSVTTESVGRCSSGASVTAFSSFEYKVIDVSGSEQCSVQFPLRALLSG